MYHCFQTNYTMKKVSLVLLLLTLGFSSTFAAIGKEEKKRIKKELKQYKKDPESYKKMVTGYKNEIKEGNATIKTQKNELISAAEKQVALEKQVARLTQELEDCMNRPIPVCPTPGAIPATGSVYKVQFGLYEKFDISGYFTTPKFIGVEKVQDKYNAYMVSYFDTEEQAQQFKTDLMKMGLKDAFVSMYTNGQRVYEWEKNPKYKGKQAPGSIEESFGK